MATDGGEWSLRQGHQVLCAMTGWLPGCPSMAEKSLEPYSKRTLCLSYRQPLSLVSNSIACHPQSNLTIINVTSAFLRILQNAAVKKKKKKTHTKEAVVKLATCPNSIILLLSVRRPKPTQHWHFPVIPCWLHPQLWIKLCGRSVSICADVWLAVGRLVAAAPDTIRSPGHT